MESHSTKRKNLPDRNLYFIFITTLFAVMGVASLAPAFPQISEHFNISKQQVGYLVIVFTLPGIVLTPFTGILADRAGRKAVLVPSLLLFGLAGTACIWAPDFNTLLVLRSVQGIGASSLGAINVTLIGDLYSGKTRAEAMGYNASVLSVGTASYPFLGGALAMLSWQYVFILPALAIPFGLVVVGMFHPEYTGDRQNFFDYASGLFKAVLQKSVIGLLLLNILVFFLIYGAFITYLPALLKERLTANSLQIGLTMSMMSVTTAIISAQTGRINRRWNERSVLITGIILYGFSMLLFVWTYHWWFITLPVVVFGVGQGLFMPRVQTRLVGHASVKERAAFMSLNSMVLRTGQTIGPAIIGLAYSWGGFKGAYLGGACIAMVMLIIATMTLGKTVPDQ